MILSYTLSRVIFHLLKYAIYYIW